MAKNIFLDTEFTDFQDCHLISLGMAAESGETFYAEVPYPDSACSAFVREAVLPLLGRIPDAACDLDTFRLRVTDWLESVRPTSQELTICFDYQGDWDLFIDALNYRVPPWCRPRLVWSKLDELRLYEYHKEHKLPEHHALYDAQAARYAFRDGTEE
jgi:hypothetical protein